MFKGKLLKIKNDYFSQWMLKLKLKGGPKIFKTVKLKLIIRGRIRILRKSGL